MNILFLSTEIPFPADGGHHLRTFNVLKILAKEHNIYMVAFAQDPSELQYVQEIEKYCRLVKVFPVAKTGKNPAFLFLMLRNLFSNSPLVAHRYYQTPATKFVQDLVRTHDIDLIHIDMLALGSYRHLFRGKPVLLTDHNVEFVRLERWFAFEKNPLLKLYLQYQHRKLKNFEIETCRQVDHCIVVSDFDLIILGNSCQQGRYCVVPNGVDTAFFLPSFESQIPNHMVWVGGMRGPYNSDAVNYFISEIWPRIHRYKPDVTVNFIGAAPTSPLRKAAEKDKRISILGHVEDVRPYVDKAAVFIAPIRCGSGTKIKVLNAMSQAKAIVATSIAVEGIEVENGANVFIADTPDEFAKRAVELLSNPQLVIKLGSHARKLIEEKYNWELIAQDLLRLYGLYSKPAKSIKDQ